jgi:hypothetical protein
MKGNKMFLHVFKFPEGGAIKLVGIKTPVKSATALDGGASVQTKTETDANGSPVLVISAPAKTDPIATVIALEFDSTPQIDLSASAVQADADGSINLSAKDAVLNARKAKLNGEVIGSWTDQRDAILWDFLPKSAGKYKVEVTYASDKDSAGSEYAVNVGDSKLAGKVESTGGNDSWRSVNVGEIDFGEGLQTLMIRPTKLAKDALMNLKAVKLTPVT